MFDSRHPMQRKQDGGLHDEVRPTVFISSKQPKTGTEKLFVRIILCVVRAQL